MAGVISTNFGVMVPHGKLDACIALLEEGLRALSRTPYHTVLGRDFLHETDAAAAYLAKFHRDAQVYLAKLLERPSAKVEFAALYFEMNGFTINPDRWYCDGFAYESAGDIWELDWLSSWDAAADDQLTLTGMEPVQEAFASLYSVEEQPLGVQLAGEIAEHLVTARFMQLIAAAHQVAKRQYPGVKGLQVLATAHDWDTVHRTV